MTIRHIRIFITVYEKESITKASKALFMTQPAVSLAIRELEDYYQVKLFDRYKQRIIPTESGKRLYIEGKALIQSFDNLDLAFKNESSNENVHFGSSLSFSTYILPNILSKANLDYTLTVATSDRLIKLVEDGKLLFAVIEGNLRVNLEEELLYNDELVIVASKEMLEKYNNKEFINIPLLVRNENSGTREVLDSVLEKLNLKSYIKVESQTNEALTALAKNNQGFAVVPYCTVSKDIENEILKIFDVDKALFSRKIRIIYSSVNKNNKLLHKWKAYIKENLA